jgi:hypothetical protein
MTTRHVLFISGSIGLGHVTRDLAIAAALRERRPEVHIVWLAGHPAQQALRAAGEELLPECGRYADETAFVEAIAGVPLEYGETTPECLAEAVLANLGREVCYPPVHADGAENAARLLCTLF